MDAFGVRLAGAVAGVDCAPAVHLKRARSGHRQRVSSAAGSGRRKVRPRSASGHAGRMKSIRFRELPRDTPRLGEWVRYERVGIAEHATQPEVALEQPYVVQDSQIQSEPDWNLDPVSSFSRVLGDSASSSR
jgi:hypothetical protein